MACPICKSLAQEIEPGFFDGKTFRCPKHGEFQVADTVYCVKGCMDAGSDRWEAALKRATGRTSAGARPRILTYDF
jgi:hypothetical protein